MADREPRPRRADIDALRVFAVLTVLVVHCAQVFSPWQTWHVQNATRSRLLAEGMLIAGLWVMPLFMLLAGRSAWHARARHSDGTYLIQRTRRLLPALVIGTLVVVPPQLYVRRLLDGSFSGSFPAFYPHFFDGFYPEGNFSWGHLWFLGYLLVYAFITLPVLRWIDRRVARADFVPRGRHVLMFLALAVGAQVALRAPFPQTNALIHDWANHALLLSAFLAGYVLSASPRIEELVVKQSRWALALALTVSAALAIFAWPGAFNERLPATYSHQYALFWMVEGIAAWAWLVAITGFARVRIKDTTPILRYTRDLVYPFYVFHQTAIVLIAWKLVALPIPILPKFAVLAALALAATAILAMVSAAAPWGRSLFGMKPNDAPALSHARVLVRRP